MFHVLPNFVSIMQKTGYYFVAEKYAYQGVAVIPYGFLYNIPLWNFVVLWLGYVAIINFAPQMRWFRQKVHQHNLTTNGFKKYIGAS